MSFAYHGNHCGPGWSDGKHQPSVRNPGPSVDEFDETCRKHDKAYAEHREGLITDAQLEAADAEFIKENTTFDPKRAFAAFAMAAQRYAREPSERTGKRDEYSNSKRPGWGPYGDLLKYEWDAWKEVLNRPKQNKQNQQNRPSPMPPPRGPATQPKPPGQPRPPANQGYVPAPGGRPNQVMGKSRGYDGAQRYTDHLSSKPQAKTLERPKRPSGGGSKGGVFNAPVAVGNRTNRGKPTRVTARRGDSEVLEGTAYIGPVVTAGIAPNAGDNLYTFNLVPEGMGDAMVTQYAAMYDNFEYQKLVVHYTAACPTSTPGSIQAYYVQDPDAGLVTGIDNIRAAFNASKTEGGPVWENQFYPMPYKKNDELFFCDPSNSDSRITTQGSFRLISSIALPASTTLGILHASFKIRFFNRHTHLSIGQRYANAKVTTFDTTNPTTSPFSAIANDGQATANWGIDYSAGNWTRIYFNSHGGTWSTSIGDYVFVTVSQVSSGANFASATSFTGATLYAPYTRNPPAAATTWVSTFVLQITALDPYIVFIYSANTATSNRITAFRLGSIAPLSVEPTIATLEGLAQEVDALKLQLADQGEDSESEDEASIVFQKRLRDKARPSTPKEKRSNTEM